MGQTLIIKKEDRENAMAADRSAILRRVDRMSKGAYHDFIRQNLKALEPVLKRYAPELYRENAAAMDPKKSDSLSRAALKKMSLGVANQINMAPLGLEKTNPVIFAQERLEREIKRAQEIKRGKDQFKHSIKSFGKGIYSVARLPLLAGMGLWNVTMTAPANMLASAFDIMGVSKTKRAALLVAAWGGIGAAMAAPVDAAPYVGQMDEYRNAFKQACTPDFLKLSASNAAYSLNFDSTTPHSKEKHAHDTMMMAARHGVPAIALHLISYLETGKFTDMRANNSSASNPFQVITSTKAQYIKDYGTKTFLYQDAKERIAQSRGTVIDKSLVRAIDAISAMSRDKLKDMVASQNYPGYVHDALVHADTSAMAAELVALDLLKKRPDIKNPNLAAENIVTIVKEYYASEHFLGAGNFSKLQQIAEKTPNISITNAKAMTASYGADMAANMRRIVTANPGLLEDGMTASKALSSITEKFRLFVDTPLKEFAKVYNPRITTLDLCVTDPETLKNMPRTITVFEKALRDSGMFPIAKKLAGMAEPTARDALRHISEQFNNAPDIKQNKAPDIITTPLPPKRPGHHTKTGLPSV